MKTGSKLAIIVLTLAAIAHLLRLILGINLTIGDWNTPPWISLLGVAVPGFVAWLLWKESK